MGVQKILTLIVCTGIRPALLPEDEDLDCPCSEEHLSWITEPDNLIKYRLSSVLREMLEIAY